MYVAEELAPAGETGVLSFIPGILAIAPGGGEPEADATFAANNAGAASVIARPPSHSWCQSQRARFLPGAELELRSPTADGHKWGVRDLLRR